MATQNPIESEGTYPLPEAQLDRFMLKVVVGYPAPEEELTVVERSLAGLASVRRTIEIDELAALRAATERLRRPGAQPLRDPARDGDAGAGRGA